MGEKINRQVPPIRLPWFQALVLDHSFSAPAAPAAAEAAAKQDFSRPMGSDHDDEAFGFVTILRCAFDHRPHALGRVDRTTPKGFGAETTIKHVT